MNKKKFLSSVLAAVFMLGSTTAFAQENGALSETAVVASTAELSNVQEDTYSDGVLVYTELSDGTYEVICLNDCSLTSVNIPSTVNEKIVTSIGAYAFYCEELTSVTIPDSVKRIGDSAFDSCRGLTSITIPDSVTSIGAYAFFDCSGLTSVTIPDSVTSIGAYAFFECGGLTSVTIANGVTSIGDCAFDGCEGLTSVTIPNSVTSIGKRAFCDCKGLTSVTISNSVTSIGERAFCSCEGLTSVTIPNSVTNIGIAPFAYCVSLSAIDVESDNAEYCSIGGVLFNKSKTVLIQFPEGSKRMDYAIPNSVTSIEGYAFECCSGLTSVTFPDSVTRIGSTAFYSCGGLTSVTIPDSVMNIESFAFASCGGLTSITILNNVTSIGWGAFSDCKNLKDVYYSGTEEQWKNVAVENDNDPLLNATIHYNSTGPVGTPVEVTVNAPDGVDVSEPTATVIVDNETKTITITNGLLDASELADGAYTFTFSAKNCAPRAYNVTVANGTANGLDGGVELYLFGDINGDGSIKMADVRLAFKATRNSSELTEYQFAVADASKDGSVKMADVRAIYKHTRGESLWK